MSKNKHAQFIFSPLSIILTLSYKLIDPNPIHDNDQLLLAKRNYCFNLYNLCLLTVQLQSTEGSWSCRALRMQNVKIVCQYLCWRNLNVSSVFIDSKLSLDVYHFMSVCLSLSLPHTHDHWWCSWASSHLPVALRVSPGRRMVYPTGYKYTLIVF